ncbi:hypothetical protein P692DRAFT_201016922 [Suillus brevipes Sb2]|nr:hypothetical protein P692DRAFT_201016922 [Suillus brevipes Sb2]
MVPISDTSTLCNDHFRTKELHFVQNLSTLCYIICPAIPRSWAPIRLCCFLTRWILCVILVFASGLRCCVGDAISDLVSDETSCITSIKIGQRVALPLHTTFFFQPILNTTSSILFSMFSVQNVITRCRF